MGGGALQRGRNRLSGRVPDPELGGTSLWLDYTVKRPTRQPLPGGSVPLSLAATALLGSAFAAEPTVTQLEDHRIAGAVVVQASIDQVRSVVSDPVLISRIDNSGTVIKLLGSQGGCTSIHTTVTHPIASIAYDAEVCPIESGWRTRMVKSDDLQAFESVWRVHPAADGHTRVEYEVRTIPDFPVPQFVVDRQTRSSVDSLLKKLRTHLENG